MMGWIGCKIERWGCKWWKGSCISDIIHETYENDYLPVCIEYL